MDILVNKFLGKDPKNSDSLVNIYAFMVNTSIYLEFVDINYLVWNIVPIFFNKLMDEKMQGYSPASRDGVLRDDIARSVELKAAIHLVFNRQAKTLVITEENSEPKKKSKGTEPYLTAVNLIQKTAYWLHENPDFVGEEDLSDISVRSNSPYLNHQNYAIYSIESFPKLLALIDNYNESPFYECSIITVDYNDKGVMESLKNQIGSSFTGQDLYLTQKPIVIDGAQVFPPTIVINMRGKNWFKIEKDLYKFISEGSGTSFTERNKKSLGRQVDLGYSLEDLYYFHFGGSNGRSLVSEVSSNFDNEANADEKETVNKALTAFDVDPNDKEAANFVKAWFSYKNVFPIVQKDGSRNPRYNKTFYYVVSISKPSGSVPSDPATKNHNLFVDGGDQMPDSVTRGLFKVLSSKTSSKRVYYLLSSDYCLPQSVFSIFSYKADGEPDSEIELHNIFEFNQKNGTLSSYPFVDEKIQDSTEKIFYNTAVLSDFPNTISEELGDKLVDNRFNDKVIVKTISEFPSVYEKVSKWFKDAGIPYRDLKVVFIYDISPEGFNKLGGYTSKNLMNSDYISLVTDLKGISKVSDFTLPVILLNIAHKTLQYRENLSTILTHECRHFFDDILVELKINPPGFLTYPDEYYTTTDAVKKNELYLSTPAEQNAYKEEILEKLERYSFDYVMKNYTGLKNKIIYELMGFSSWEIAGTDETRAKINGIQLAIHLFSRIFDQAFSTYERENSNPELETKN